MTVSVFELFKIGIGPSSSHTVGPMRAGKKFISVAAEKGLLQKSARIHIDLYGSLALTGKGHGTDLAVLLGVEGNLPDEIDPDQVPFMMARIRTEHTLKLNGQQIIPFEEKTDLVFHYLENLPYHPNGMRFSLYDANNHLLFNETFYSIGGGFIVNDTEIKQHVDHLDSNKVPYPFDTGAELLAICKQTGKSIAEIVMENEKTKHTEAEIRAGVLKIWEVMKTCIERGCRETGILPGGLKVKRRAHDLYQRLLEQEKQGKRDEMHWINLYALAVNEENAAGGRVVTAPTNGAAGVIPAILNYYVSFTPDANEESIVNFLLT